MRFILMYKYGILQTKTERIDVNFCETTTQLLQYLEKRVGQTARNFLVRIKKANHSYRIIAGWPLATYELKEGTELHIEILQNILDISHQPNVNARYLNTLLGARHTSMEPIQEMKEIENQGETRFTVRKYLDFECEKMLKQIQHRNLKGFLEIFQEYPEEIEEHELIEIQTRKPQLIDELGQKGWGALHYAIFCEATQIFDELLEMEVDVNKCTSDGWLPIQLAINIKSRYCIEKLLAQPTLSLSLVTIRGSPLHAAAREGNKDILKLFLQKEVDVNAKDNAGKTLAQVCSDPMCLELLKKYEDKKETYNQYVKGSIPLSLTTIIRGTIMKVKRPFMKLRERYLLIDPFQGSLIRFQCQADFPKKPKQITPLSSLQGMRMLQAEQKSWHMRKELYYFQIDKPNKEIYACKYPQTVQKWLTNFKMAVQFAQELEKNPQLISEIQRNQIIIEDKLAEVEVPRKVKKNVFNLNPNSFQSQGSKNSDNMVSPTKVDPSHSTGNFGQGADKELQATNRAQKPQERRAQPATSEVLSKQLNEITTNKVNFASFTIINTLGAGAFGKVFLAKLISNGQLYALKALKKKNLILHKQLKYAIIEANILKQANNQFIINLHFAFQTPHYLYLALDYCPGRDLSFHLAREITFPEDQARFYIAQLCLAIEHLHQKNIIYRDLKPENILLDGQGNVKLADFGLSKQTNDDKTKSFCGSPAYLSPEMLAHKGAGKESDLYGIGAVLYQCLIGEPPYFSDDIPTLYKNIKEGRLKFPKNVSDSAKNFITALLEREPKKRLGAQGWSQIKEHAFFAGLDWDKLIELKLPSPKRPEVQDEEDEEDEMDIIQNNKRNNFTDFDYEESTRKINRLMNFSFVRNE